MPFHEIEVFVVVDDDGQYAVGVDIETMTMAYTEAYNDMPAGARRIKIKLKIEQCDTVVEAIVPAQSQPIVRVIEERVTE
jgi:hypothetical protein